MQCNVNTWTEYKENEFFEDFINNKSKAYTYIDAYEDVVEGLNQLDITYLLEAESSETYYEEFRCSKDTIKQLIENINELIKVQNKFDCEQMIEEAGEKADRHAMMDGSDLYDYNEDGEEEDMSWR